jgi:hypothetical protein
LDSAISLLYTLTEHPIPGQFLISEKILTKKTVESVAAEKATTLFLRQEACFEAEAPVFSGFWDPFRLISQYFRRELQFRPDHLYSDKTKFFRSSRFLTDCCR